MIHCEIERSLELSSSGDWSDTIHPYVVKHKLMIFHSV